MIGQPSADISLLGDLTVSVVSSESHQKSYGSVVGSWMQRVLVNSGFVDASSLCIVPGKSAWRLQVVSCVMCDDGNVADAALLAAVAALQDTMLPSVLVDPKGTGRTAPEEEWKPLQVDSTRIPIPLSIGWYKWKDSTELLPLVDPLEIESRHCVDTCITIVVTSDTKEIINVNQTGALPLSSREIARAATMVFGRAEEVSSLLRHF
jgi:exosome complex RNA-binding protein Rrp42 (RNase PH superfamily)